jgi:hypothetical protein
MRWRDRIGRRGHAADLWQRASAGLRFFEGPHGVGTGARFASKLIGEREVIRPTVSRTRKGGFLAEPGHSVSRGEQHVTEAAVLAAEIEQLPDLAGYLKFASRPAWLRVRLPPP